MNTNELTGAALDWAVARCEGQFDRSPHTGNGANFLRLRKGNYLKSGVLFSSTDWAQGGPIIEREKIALDYLEDLCGAGVYRAGELKHLSHGPTPLIAAMRCYVASKLGDTVELPEALC